jgi:hypothetical protein
MTELISVHIPKTAGTAFRHVLIEVYGLDGVLEDYPPDKIYQVTKEIAPKIKVIHGHFAPGKYDKFTQAKRIVWLRHPIFRLISEYFFAKTINDRNNAIHAQLLEKNLDILDFARIPAMTNFMSQKLEGMKLEQFDFVGIQEFYLQDLVDLQQLMGWQNFQPTVKNSNRYPEYYQCLQDILNDRALMNALAQVNQEDMQLYNSALTMRAKRRQESVLVQSTLADWQRSQYLLEQIAADFNRTQSQLKQLHYWSDRLTVSTNTWQLKLADKPQVTSLLTGFHIDSPQEIIPLHSKLIEVSGWAIGRNSPATQLLIAVNNQILCQTKIDRSRPDVAQVYPLPTANKSGFMTELAIGVIPSQTKLDLKVMLQNGTQVTIATISAKETISNK